MTRYPPWDPKARLRICGGDDCPYSNADDGGHAPGFATSGHCSWCGEGYEADPASRGIGCAYCHDDDPDVACDCPCHEEDQDDAEDWT